MNFLQMNSTEIADRIESLEFQYTDTAQQLIDRFLKSFPWAV